MKDFDHDRYSFSVLTVEQPNQKLRELLYEKNYIYITSVIGLDEIWVSRRF